MTARLPTTERDLASLRRACVHEAGHMAICNAFGDSAKARIWRGVDGSFCGQVKPARWPYPPQERRMVALAGTCATSIDAGLVADQVYDLLLSGELRLSAADVPLAGQYSRDDIRAVSDLLLPRWSNVLATAEWLATAVGQGFVAVK